MKRTAATKKVHTAGEWGVNRVWLSQAGKKFRLEWYEERSTGRRTRRRRALGPCTLGEAKLEVDLLATELRQRRGTSTPSTVTLKELFDNYEAHVTVTKAMQTQGHDRRAMALFCAFWGPTQVVSELRPLDWQSFIRKRGNGSLRHPEQPKRPVGNRVIEQDLKLLRAVLNWGLKNEYLDRVPMAHESFPREASPKRPILYEDDFERMLAIAPEVHPLCPLALILGHETGHRIGAIGRLRWSDIDLEAGSIRWSKEGDKQDREHVVPVSDRALAALRQYDTGDRNWLFPSPVRPGQPMGREVFTKWWGQLEERAGLAHESGRGWHALRRTFATERKELPLADLAVAGGWTGIQTLTKCYIQPDEATVRKVVNHRKPLLRTAVEK